MTKFNTGNPVGSADPRDLSDNAKNFDEAVNNPSSATWTDRLGKRRVTLAAQLGYTIKGDYAAGIELTKYNDVIQYEGEFYGPAAGTSLPYTTTATPPDADSNLVGRGDLVLRQDLAADPSSGNAGSLLVNGVVHSVPSRTAMKAYDVPAGTQFSLEEGGRSGKFVVKSGTPANDPSEGVFIVLDNGLYAEREHGQNAMMYPSVKAQWFGVVADGVTINDTDYQNAVNFTANRAGRLVHPTGQIYLSTGIVVPEVAGDFFGEQGMTIEGTHRTTSEIITDQNIELFDICDFVNFQDITLRQTAGNRQGKGVYSANQIRFCSFNRVNITNFKYGGLFRFTLWCSFKDVYFVDNACGLRLARNAAMEDQTNPGAVSSWNQATGWFHNQNTFENVLCNGGEIGIWASCMGCTFDNITCQNQLTDGATNQVLPLGVKGTGMWLEGGGATSSDTFNNVIINYYVEDTLNALVVKEHRESGLVINGWFTQGIAGAETWLDVEESFVTIKGQTSQTAGFATRIKGVDSTVVSEGRILVSGAADNLTNTIVSENGTVPTGTIPTFNATVSPETSGSITLDGTAQSLSYERHGNWVTVSGRLDVSAVSSPSGNFVDIGALPIQIAQLTDRAGSGAFSVLRINSGVASALPGLFNENGTSLRAYLDASTIAAGDVFYLSATYPAN